MTFLNTLSREVIYNLQTYQTHPKYKNNIIFFNCTKQFIQTYKKYQFISSSIILENEGIIILLIYDKKTFSDDKKLYNYLLNNNHGVNCIQYIENKKVNNEKKVEFIFVYNNIYTNICLDFEQKKTNLYIYDDIVKNINFPLLKQTDPLFLGVMHFCSIYINNIIRNYSKFLLKKNNSNKKILDIILSYLGFYQVIT